MSAYQIKNRHSYITNIFNFGKRAFSSPNSVLSRLGIDELCDVFEEYGRLSGEAEIERGINENFSAKTDEPV